MRLFKRRLPDSAPSTEVAGLEQLAATRHWRSVDPPPLGSTLADRIFVANFVLYDRRKRLSSNDPAEVRVGHFRNSYEGEVDGRHLVVANHSTNVAQLRIYEWKAVSVCAVQLGTICPVVVIQPRSLPPVARLVPEDPTGNAEFDARFITLGMTGIGPQLLDENVRQRIEARDDWLFLGDDDWFVCVGRDPFHDADAVARRLDEVLDIIGAMPRSLVPARVDHSVDDLTARIARISTVEDALAFLQGLGDDDRRRLAASDTPLAAFADVTTPDEAMERLQSLDVAERMKLLRMFQDG
jgi:hypothetical protein